MRIRDTGQPVYRLKVTLRGPKPPIWRRFLVPGDITLKRLHDSLQAVMGWTDSHLHQFRYGGVLYGTTDRELDFVRVSEIKTRLNELLREPKDRLVYEYDFGDGWEHDVVLEAILPPGRAGRYPVIEAGRRACPPEDVGGVHGYKHFLTAIAHPMHPEHAELLEWAGGGFDPEDFDPEEANEAIHGGSAPSRAPERSSTTTRAGTVGKMRGTALNFTVESEQETDGRWIAAVRELPGASAYGASRDEALAKTLALALRVLAERLERGEAAPTLSVSFNPA